MPSIHSIKSAEDILFIHRSLEEMMKRIMVLYHRQLFHAFPLGSGNGGHGGVVSFLSGFGLCPGDLCEGKALSEECVQLDLPRLGVELGDLGGFLSGGGVIRQLSSTFYIGFPGIEDFTFMNQKQGGLSLKN